MSRIFAQTGKTTTDSISVTAFLSATLHAVVILGLGFTAPQFMSTNTIDNSLDVVLLNQSNQIDPEEAKLIAQSASTGGGSSSKEASTPIPWKQVNPSKVEQIALKAKTEKTIEKISDEVMTQIGKNEFAAVIKKEEQEKQQEQTEQPLNTQEQVQREIQRLAAKIDKKQEEYNKRPKREFFSASAKQSDSAAYVKNWQRKVERIGQNNFPDEIRRKKLNGILIVDVAIKANGTIDAIKIITSSGNKLLDDTTVKFIRMASPYRPFDDSMNERIDIIHITRAYFLSGQKITSQSVSR